VVRVCEPTYAVDALQATGISVLDWEFSDGSPPPREIIDKWMALIKDSFKEHPDQCIAVHCVAGLGRAPVMVALALMEAGMQYEDAVDLIRQYVCLFNFIRIICLYLEIDEAQSIKNSLTFSKSISRRASCES
jgi:protein-tyrosine phosphatase